MKPTLRTRKPIDRLTLSDLRAFPIWEFATDEEAIEGRDETWVRPIRAKTVPANAYSLSVAAAFRAASGKTYRGIVGVTTAGGLDIGHAAILSGSNYVFIPWPGFAEAARSARAAARDLRLSRAQLFPLAYELAVPIRGESSLRKGTYAYSDA